MHYDLTDISTACGCTRQTLHYWAKKIPMPKPDYAKGKLTVYSHKSVTDWLQRIAGGKYAARFAKAIGEKQLSGAGAERNQGSHQEARP